MFYLTLNTSHLQLYGIRHMVKDQLDSERENPLPPHGLHFLISSKGYFICQKQFHCIYLFLTPIADLFFVLGCLKHSFIPTLFGRKNVLFNDALNTFYLRLYGVRHMVKDHSDSERGNPLLPHGLLFPINSKGSFICTIPQTG